MKGRFSNIYFERSNSSGSICTDEGLFEQPEPLASSKAIVDKVLRRRSLEMRDQQEAWQVISSENLNAWHFLEQLLKALCLTG